MMNIIYLVITLSIVSVFSGAPNEQTKLISMISRIASNLYPNYDTECTIVATSSSGMDKNTSKEYFLSKEGIHATINIDGEYFAHYKDILSDYLHKNTGCAVGVYERGNSHLKDLIYLLRKVKNNFILKLDRVHPRLSDMVSSNYPIMWVEKLFKYKDEQSILLGLFCPKEDKSKSTIIRIPIIEQNKVKCPHYLEDQVLSLGHVYGFRTRIINGKAVNGEEYVRFFEYASKKFKFIPKFKLGRILYFPKNDSLGGIHGEVIEGKLLMVRGAVNTRNYKDMEVMFPHIEGNFHFISRMPKVLQSSFSLLMPFSTFTWIIMIIYLLCLSIMFYTTHSIYSFPELSYAGLHKKENNPSNFFLYTLCKLTEPDPLPWFTSRWSTGKLLMLIWSLFCLLMMSFYNCNLRAHLSAVDYEKPIDSAHDVIQHGKRPWLIAELGATRVQYLEDTGQTHTAIYQVSLMAQKMNGYYSFTKHKGVPPHAIKDIVENNAVALFMEQTLRETIRLLPRYREARNGDMLYLSKERQIYISYCMNMRKYTPVRADVNLAVMNAVESGLFIKWSQENLPIEAFLNYNGLQTYDKTKLMGFHQLSLMLLFCATGLAIAAAVLCLESFKISSCNWRK